MKDDQNKTDEVPIINTEEFLKIYDPEEKDEPIIEQRI